MLATHLSFPEIGAEMFLSPHTVKSQAMSIYRKLGASSRSQAVTRSRELGLLEGDSRFSCHRWDRQELSTRILVAAGERSVMRRAGEMPGDPAEAGHHR